VIVVAGGALDGATLTADVGTAPGVVAKAAYPDVRVRPAVDLAATARLQAPTARGIVSPWTGMASRVPTATATGRAAVQRRKPVLGVVRVPFTDVGRPLEPGGMAKVTLASVPARTTVARYDSDVTEPAVAVDGLTDTAAEIVVAAPTAVVEAAVTDIPMTRTSSAARIQRVRKPLLLMGVCIGVCPLRAQSRLLDPLSR
jgi:hypothetical protein